MKAHCERLTDLRPTILSAKVTDDMSDEEIFQNTTLRPIIKMQNELLVLVFKNYINKRKNVFFSLELNRKLDYIENAIKKDLKFKSFLKGLIIGQFTKKEYLTYIKNPSSLDKRMMNIIKERLISQVQIFTSAAP